MYPREPALVSQTVTPEAVTVAAAGVPKRASPSQPDSDTGSSDSSGGWCTQESQPQSARQ